MIKYPAEKSLHEGLGLYLHHYSLGDGGYNDRWFKLPFLWSLTIPVPNIRNRRLAVKFHDLHHVLTEYETGLAGEAEIGAWEIASGCGIYYSAWILNFMSLVYGLIALPSRTFMAFIRGRHSASLYHSTDYELLLLKSIGEMRMSLHLPEGIPKPTLTDMVAFILWALFAVLIVLVPIAIALAIVQVV
jgi:hypothetical protein